MYLSGLKITFTLKHMTRTPLSFGILFCEVNQAKAFNKVVFLFKILVVVNIKMKHSYM